MFQLLVSGGSLRPRAEVPRAPERAAAGGHDRRGRGAGERPPGRVRRRPAGLRGLQGRVHWPQV